MKKILKYLTFAFLLSVIGVGFGQSRHVIKTDAASPATKRIWAKIKNKGEWDSAGAHTQIHYWGGTGATTHPGVDVNYDPTNDLVYYDVDPSHTHVLFARISPENTVWNQTPDLVIPNPLNNNIYYIDGYGTTGGWGGFSFQTTKVVSDFAATIDTSAEACTQALAQAAIDAYNNLATFEQHQYAALDVGSGQTGLDRLNYLKARYNIVTPLSSNVSPRSVATENTTTATLIIGALGVTSLAGYYFISKKKLFA